MQPAAMSMQKNTRKTKKNPIKKTAERVKEGNDEGLDGLVIGNYILRV